MFPPLVAEARFAFPNLIFALVYLLIIWERIPKVVSALLGATLVILAGILTQERAFEYVDFNVIFLLVGMMIIVHIMQKTGVFDWMAYAVARRVGGRGVLLMLALSLMTAVFSAFLDNVTTVLFMASITCTLASSLQINPVPYLMAEVIASNVGGTATLIGDPPNILIGSAAGLSFNDFLVHVAPVVLIILPVALVTLFFIYRDELHLPMVAQKKLQEISLDGLITDRALLKKSVIVLGLVLAAFMLHHLIHQEVGTIALAGAAVLMLFEDPREIWRNVEWDTIFFFIGLFIVVGAVEEVGTLHFLSEVFMSITHGDLGLTSLLLLWVSGVLSAIIDNIPYTATVIPMVQELGAHYDDIGPLWWALSLGACLGGNGTIIGATANVLVVDMAANRCGYRIKFMSFLKVGSFIMLESLLISSAYLWLRYLM